jgi:hypothetical protein
MEIQVTLLARSIRLVKVSTAVGYWPDVVKELGAHYSFARIPDIQEILEAQKAGSAKGAEFHLGRLRRADGRLIVIEKFTVFNDGLVVDTRTSTGDCDLFLDNIEQWAKTNLSAIKNVGRSFYLSQLEVKLQANEYAKMFDPLGDQIFALMTEYGVPSGITPFRLGTFALAMEPSHIPGIQPSPFSIERRINIPFNENVFFAQAPLRTSDHIKLLDLLEQALARI